MPGVGVGVGVGVTQKFVGGVGPANAFLTANGGAIWDFTTFGRLWQDSAGATPVTAAAQPIGLVRNRADLSALTCTQATGAAQPTAQTGYAGLDGGDWMAGDAAVLTMTQNKSAFVFGFRGLITNLAANNTLLVWSNTTNNNNRLRLLVTNNGSLYCNAQRTAADTPVAVQTGTGFVTTNTIFSGITVVDAAGAGTIKLYANDSTTVRASASLGGTLGNIENTAASTMRIGGSRIASPIELLVGQAMKGFASPGLPTDAEIASLFALLAAA